ncbi:hypothetical protein GCM10023339_77070 [Alloalcanivorax gelatiniphagus]
MLTRMRGLRLPVVRRGRRRDESGTIAVMVAVMSVAILGMAAVAIDVGQVYAKRASLQSAVDQAVLAAAAELDGTTVCTAGAIDAAKQYLLSNWIDQGGDPKALADIDLGGSAADGNGFMNCNRWRVDLWSPTARVNLGLAKAVTDETNVQVPAHAAAEVRSPRLGTLPFYATPTCSTGQQVLSTDSSGHASLPVIPLTPSTATLNTSNVTALAPSSTPVGTPITAMVVTGTNFTSPAPGVTAVGFTNASGDHFQVAIGAGATITSSTRISVTTIPFPVASEDIWYVRVLKGGTWSAKDGNATTGVKKFTVGDEKLYCNLSDKGNFGSLKIQRTPAISNPNTLIYHNTALGVDHELSTAPGAPSAPKFCSAGGGFVTGPVDGQNCLATDTGLPANALEEGLITGSSPVGRLRKTATSPCARANITVSSYSLNDDVLSCFFTNPTTRVGDVTKSSFTGEPVISPAIFDSPRFVWVPIITEPPSGASQNVSIQGFKPGFITDQPASGSAGSHATTSTGVPNGLTLSGTKVREMRIWFIHPNALPSSSTAEGHEVAYRGTGAKVIVLVD